MERSRFDVGFRSAAAESRSADSVSSLRFFACHPIVNLIDDTVSLDLTCHRISQSAMGWERIIRGGFFHAGVPLFVPRARSSRPLGFLPTIGNARVICFALRSFPRVWPAVFVREHIRCFSCPMLLPACRLSNLIVRCPANVLTTAGRVLAPSRAECLMRQAANQADSTSRIPPQAS